jgi:hypothetical protein
VIANDADEPPSREYSADTRYDPRNNTAEYEPISLPVAFIKIGRYRKRMDGGEIARAFEARALLRNNRRQHRAKALSEPCCSEPRCVAPSSKDAPLA